MELPVIGRTYTGAGGVPVTVTAIEGGEHELRRVVVSFGGGVMRFPLHDWPKWLQPRTPEYDG